MNPCVDDNNGSINCNVCFLIVLVSLKYKSASNLKLPGILIATEELCGSGWPMKDIPIKECLD